MEVKQTHPTPRGDARHEDVILEKRLFRPPVAGIDQLRYTRLRFCEVNSDAG